MLASRQDLRIAQRHVLANGRICSIAIEEKSFEVVGNLSYGGFNLLLPNNSEVQKTKPNENGRNKYKLKLLGLETEGEAVLVYTGVNSNGFSFCHDSAKLLIFLNPFLEKMRLGATMTKVPNHLKRDRYQEEGWDCYHGDGPTDVRVQSKDGKINEAIVSFRIGEDYHDIVFKDGKFSTRTSIDKEGVAARMAKSNAPSAELMRQAICVLIGLCGDKVNPEANQLLNFALDHLNP